VFLKLFPSARYSWQRIRSSVFEWLSIGLLVLIILGPAVMLGWLVLFTSTFTIQAVTIVDAREQTADAIRGLSAAMLGDNILSTQTTLLEQRIRNNIPQVLDVHVIRKLPATLKIIVQEKTAALLLISNGKYYFIDSRGLAYEEARLESLPGTVLPIVKNQDPGSRAEVGLPVVTENFVTFVLEGSARLPEISGAEVVEIRMPSLAAREAHFLLENNWLIRFDSTREVAGQLAILNELITHTIPTEELPEIEYIDLRIPNRIYYRTRSASREAQVSATAPVIAPDSD